MPLASLPSRLFAAKRDARYLQAAVLCLYAVVAREVFHFERSHWTTLTCVATAVSLDLLLGRFYYKKVIFPLSAIIIGLASSLLIDAPSVLTYVAATALGISSKTLITYKRKHLFNPANFGLVVMLLVFPNRLTGMPQLFSGYLAPSIVFAVLGMLTVLYARQFEVSFSWLLGFVVFACARAAINGSRLLMTLAPALGPGFLLFTFHMISDPATTPRTRRFRIAFGVTVALLDALTRFFEIPYGNFYALFLVTALLPCIRDRETP